MAPSGAEDVTRSWERYLLACTVSRDVIDDFLTDAGGMTARAANATSVPTAL